MRARGLPGRACARARATWAVYSLCWVSAGGRARESVSLHLSISPIDGEMHPGDVKQTELLTQTQSSYSNEYESELNSRSPHESSYRQEHQRK